MSLAQAAAPVISGMHAQPDLALPSMTRVIVSVIIALALAAGVLYLLKRFLPNIGVRGVHDGFIKVLGRAHVTPKLQAHILQIDSTRVLVVESRHGVTLTVLPATAAPRADSGVSTINSDST
jgi:flagellar biogenesis protein FliO